MNIFRIVALSLSALLLGAAMTSPSIPEAVTEAEESSAVMRTGVVVDIVDADNITVKISGSNVLVRAFYLFPQYGPVLGDIVLVSKQDAQWAVLGTLSGPINTALSNPSFETGALGATPPNWSINVLASAGGVPTFTKVNTVEEPISGSFSADFGTDSTVAGLSQADVFSDSIPAGETDRWTAAYFIALASIDQNATTGISGGRFSVLELYIQFLDSGGALVSETLISTFGTNANVPFPVYKRPSVGTTYATAPPNTASVRMKIRGTFDMSANSFTSFFLDYMVLRKIR